jgi:hypothetical protein
MIKLGKGLFKYIAVNEVKKYIEMVWNNLVLMVKILTRSS